MLNPVVIYQRSNLYCLRTTGQSSALYWASLVMSHQIGLAVKLTQASVVCCYPYILPYLPHWEHNLRGNHVYCLPTSALPSGLHRRPERLPRNLMRLTPSHCYRPCQYSVKLRLTCLPLYLSARSMLGWTFVWYVIYRHSQGLSSCEHGRAS
jgi:hypothetical protein